MITSSARLFNRFIFEILKKNALISTARSCCLQAFIASLILALTACGGGGGGSGSPGGGAGSGGGADNGDQSKASVVITITAHPQDTVINVGETATFSVSATSTATLTYQWLHNGAVIVGANQSTYTLVNAATSDGGSYSVIVSSASQAAASNFAYLEVYAGAPFLAWPPAEQTVAAGSAATLSVVARGTPPFRFQWYKYGVPILGATAATYVTPLFAPSDSGAPFFVVVSNDFGSVSSNVATVHVASTAGEISIRQQPQPILLNEGGIATFSVAADGVGPFMYQWRRNGVEILGAYESIYRFNATNLNNGDQYSVQVSNALHSTISTSASLTVSPAAISLRAGSLGDYGNTNGVADQARFSCPTGIVGDAAGNLYVVSYYNGGAIRKISPDQMVSTFVGSTIYIGSSDGVGASARFNSPSGIAIDSSGNLYVTDGGNNTVREITSSGMVITLAGSAGTSGSSDGFGSAARFNFKSSDMFDCNLAGVAVDSTGTIFVADTFNHTIRKISPSGSVTTWVGTAGNAGFSDGNGSAARFNHPNGIAIDRDDNVFVADNYNGRVRRIDKFANVTTLNKQFDISPYHSPQTIAGIAVDSRGAIYVSHASGSIWRSDDGESFYVIAGQSIPASRDGVATEAQFRYPKGIYLDGASNLFVADDATVRKVRSDLRVSTLVGRDFSSSFRYQAPDTGSTILFTPTDIVGDSSGNIYSSRNHAVFKLSSTGEASVFAGMPYESGSTDGVGSGARFMSPDNLAVDQANNIYVSDSESHTIRKITPAGVVTTVAGAVSQSGAVDGLRSDARFNIPKGIAVDKDGNMYVADQGNQTIRKISPAGLVTTLAGSVGVRGAADGSGVAATFYDPSKLTVDNVGNVFVLEYSFVSPIRKITAAGYVSTIGGYGFPATDGSAATATFRDAKALSAASDGNVYVADGGLIRKISSGGAVTTVAGSQNSQGVLLGSLPGSLNSPQALISVPATTGAKLLMVDEASIISITLP